MKFPSHGYQRRIGPRLALPVAVVVLALAAPAQAAFPGANGKIAFERSADVWAMNPDGSDQTRLTDALGGDRYPAWSPDGAKIAFTSFQEYPDAMYIMNADGTDPTKVISRAIWPAWSPDGTRIAFASGGGTFNIWVVNVDGTGLTRLTEGSGIDNVPSWSPDGRKIAFESNRDGSGYGVYTMNSDGSNETKIAHGSEAPNWSPDGAKIAFATYRSGPYEIYTMNPDGTGQTRVGSPGDGNWPHWSPDGTKITFMRDQDPDPYVTQFAIHVMNADGTGDVQLTTGTDDRFADWQPLPGSSPPPTYEAPKLASPLRFSLVPVFRECGTTANPTDGQHSWPLSSAACLPPAPQGIARFGAQSSGSAWIAVIYGDTNAANGDQADMTFRFDLADVRTGAGADYNPNPTGADGTLVVALRFTDRANGPSGTSAGTTTNLDFPVPFNCTPTSDPALGSACALDTSADALNPGMIKENKASVVQVYRLRLNDSGLNGVRGDSDDRLFATQGFYVP